MTKNLTAFAHELTAARARLARFTRDLADIDPVGLSTKALTKYRLAQARLDELRMRIEEARRRLAEMRRRRVSRQPLVLRCDKQRLAAKGRRQARRQAAARARKKATGDPDPPPKRKRPPSGKLAGTRENIINSSAARNNPAGPRAQALRRAHCWGDRA
jgi:hypothetical protein